MRVAEIPDRRGQFQERWCEPMNRVVGLVRIGDMTLLAEHAQIAAERAAPADRDAIAQHFGGGCFADDRKIGCDAACFQHLDDMARAVQGTARSEEHTSELQSLMRNSYAVFCLN